MQKVDENLKIIFNIQAKTISVRQAHDLSMMGGNPDTLIQATTFPVMQTSC